MAFKMKYSKDGFPYKSALAHADIVPHEHGLTKEELEKKRGNAEVNKNNETNNKDLKENVIEKEGTGTSPRPKEKKLTINPVELGKDYLKKKSA